MRFAPWMELCKGGSTAAKTVLLDYNSILLPTTTLVAAVRNRHFLVASTVMIALVLKLLAVLSAGFMFAQVTAIDGLQIPINVDGDFLSAVPDASANFTDDSIATLWDGMLHSHATPPEWYLQGVAIQTLDQGSLSAADDNSTLVSSVVDGVWSDVQCEPGTATEIPRAPESPQAAMNPYYRYNITVSMQSPLCGNSQIVHVIEMTTRPGAGDEDEDGLVLFESFDDFGPGGGSRCESSDPVFTHSYHVFNYVVDQRVPSNDTTFKTILTYNHTVSLFCQPKVYLGKVKLTIQGADMQAQRLSDPEPKLIQGAVTRLVASAWTGGVTKMNRLVGNYGFQEYGIKDGFYRMTNWHAYGNDIPGVFRYMAEPNPIGRIRDINESSIKGPITSLWEQLPPLVAGLSLQLQKNSTTSGAVTSLRERLLVESGIPHVLAATLAVMCLLVVCSAIWLAPISSFCPKDPGNVIGLMMALRNSLGFLRSFSGIATLGDKETSARALNGIYAAGYQASDVDTEPYVGANGYEDALFRLSRVGHEEETPGTEERRDSSHDAATGSWYEPFNTAIWPRAVMCVVLVGIIAALAVLLPVSKRSQGLGDVSDSWYIHYTWTSLPVLIMAGIGLFFSAYDTQVRSLAVFFWLRREHGATIRELSTAADDKTAIHALVTAVRHRSWPTVASATASILTAFLTIFTATLFSVEPVPAVREVQLRQQDWFASFGNVTPPTANNDPLWHFLSSYPDGTFDYPDWTYRELVFPRLGVVPLLPGSADAYNSSAAPKNTTAGGWTTVTTRVTAIRPNQKCTLYPDSRLVWYADRESLDGFGIEINLTATDDGTGWSSDKCGNL
jgi:hypothetical protein